MDCKAVQKVIYRFVYGESDQAELMQVKRHLDRCHECEQERQLIGDILNKIQTIAAQENTEALPHGCRERILGKIHSSLQQEDRAG
jgi:anti-sigma factor (TIGR02949 family)